MPRKLVLVASVLVIGAVPLAATILFSGLSAAGAPNIIQATFTPVSQEYFPLIQSGTYTARQIEGPNLVPLRLTVNPPSPVVSQPTAFTLVLENAGKVGTVEPFWIDLYIDPSSPPNAANQPWHGRCSAPFPDCYGGAWRVSTPVAAGQQVTLTSAELLEQYSNWYDQFNTSGRHTVYAYVDSWQDGSLTGMGAITETNESDNAIGIALNVMAGP